MRATISPVKPRETASGLHRINVRSIAMERAFNEGAGCDLRRRESAAMHSDGSFRFERLRHVESTQSTNDDMARILGTPEAAGLTIVAAYQTKGNGRKGRRWIAPPGTALLFTTALPHPLPAQHLWIVPFWTALAVRSALSRFGVETRLQWPNDVLLRERKVCGILCISRVTGDVAFAACGVGINVRRFPDADAMDPPPAFTQDAGCVDSVGILDAVLREFDSSLPLLSDSTTLAASWERAAALPGTRYRIVPDDGTAPFEATALRLDDDGSLVVRDLRGERNVSMADVRVAR